MNDNNFIVKIEKNYFQMYDESENYTEAKSSYSATVNGVVRLPFAPFVELELNNYGKIIQVCYNIEAAEFNIRVEKSNITARTQAQLTEFNIKNNFEGFVDDIAQWWVSASLSVFGYGNRSRKYIINSGIATPHKYFP